MYYELKQHIKTIVSRLPIRQQKAIEKIHLFLLVSSNKIKWFRRNLKVRLIKQNIYNEKIKDINIFEQNFWSQNGEDGIIKIIFHKIGITNKFCVEFGIHSIAGNSILLAKKGWNCLWMDGNGDGKKIKKEFITAENINEIFKKHLVPKEFDLLSIDIDSNDYWVWKAIENYSPRVVIVEYNGSIPYTESKTVKYDPTLCWDGTNYFGASLLALKNLGESKGYTLIACDNKGVNAFFIRKDLIGDKFEIKNIKDIYKSPGYGKKINGKHIGHRPSERLMISV